MEIIDSKAFHNIEDGVITGQDVAKYEKKFGDVKGIYHNSNGIADDQLVYTVYSYTQGDPSCAGNLNWGLTILEPILVNGEYNMTRGHFHQDLQCAEFYFGIQGEGLLLLMDQQGKTWAEKVCKGSLHHIDGAYAHRLLNIGNVPLKVGACWPTVAGHDYETIEKKLPFKCVFCKEGHPVLEGEE